jgi:hypothetical protein
MNVVPNNTTETPQNTTEIPLRPQLYSRSTLQNTQTFTLQKPQDNLDPDGYVEEYF